jgi:hypothetical protein
MDEKSLEMSRIPDTAWSLGAQLARAIVTPSSELILHRLTQEFSVDDRVGGHFLCEFRVEVLGVHSIQLLPG